MSSEREHCRFGVVMPVGPGPHEIDRLRDAVDALEHYERGNFRLVLVDDAGEDRGLRRAVGELGQERLIIIKNPRNGRGNGWDSGCTAAVLAGLKELRNTNVQFVLKLDTDALVIRPFASRVIARFAENPAIGMLGSRYFVEGSEPDRDREFIRWVGIALEKLQRQFKIWRRSNLHPWPAVQIALWGDSGKIRDIIRNGFINGYRVGDHCQGGAYALSQACLRAFDRHGYLKNPTLWLQAPIPDDHILSLCVKALDLQLLGFDRDGEIFACRWAGLPDAPENLFRRGFAIIHSVKDHGGRTEAQTRAYFKALRQEAAREPEPSVAHSGQ